MRSGLMTRWTFRLRKRLDKGTSRARRTVIEVADWGAANREVPDELTEDVLETEDPEWTPPKAARADRWRPESHL